MVEWGVVLSIERSTKFSAAQIMLTRRAKGERYLAERT